MLASYQSVLLNRVTLGKGERSCKRSLRNKSIYSRRFGNRNFDSRLSEHYCVRYIPIQSMINMDRKWFHHTNAMPMSTNK